MLPIPTCTAQCKVGPVNVERTSSAVLASSPLGAGNFSKEKEVGVRREKASTRAAGDSISLVDLGATALSSESDMPQVADVAVAAHFYLF